MKTPTHKQAKKDGYPFVMYTDEEYDVDWEADSKEESSIHMRCDTCEDWNLIMNMVKVLPQPASKTLWFCNKKCYIAHQL